MAKNGIRWAQRFLNDQKALSQLQKFIDKGELPALEIQRQFKLHKVRNAFIHARPLIPP
ncbi:MAG: hypothetical protein PHP23_15735 [Desulfobacterales bacterium]|nr:hypothetical protein [Desulfobacterales bacterium]MDD4073790.1 hypothetical protein [Desulfobacterales bacterium]MDD4394211.1 hypothetical protein [Desulfobacterales bacterium]